MSAAVRLATLADAPAIAELHAKSWRQTYRGLFSDAFLDGPVWAERATFWTTRLSSWDPMRNGVLCREHQGQLAGFASVLLDYDPEWGARLDNLHVDPNLKGQGHGQALLLAARAWAAAREPDWPLHLLVFEPNHAARAFYAHMGASVCERRQTTVEDQSRLVEIRLAWPSLDQAGDAAP